MWGAEGNTTGLSWAESIVLLDALYAPGWGNHPLPQNTASDRALEDMRGQRSSLWGGHVHLCPAQRSLPSWGAGGGWWIQREKSLPEGRYEYQEGVSHCNAKGTWGSSPTLPRSLQRGGHGILGADRGQLWCSWCYGHPERSGSFKRRGNGQRGYLSHPQPPGQTPRLQQGREQPCNAGFRMSSKGRAPLPGPLNHRAFGMCSPLRHSAKGLSPKRIYGAVCWKVKLGREEEGATHLPWSD